MAKLLSPQEGCAFRNVAVAPLQAMDATAPVAIIWQNDAEPDRKSELYLYEIPGSLWRIFRDRHSRQDSIYSIQTHIRNLNCCVEIQAKRVHSLESGAGGIHLFSPVRNHLRTFDEGRSEMQDELGGLVILQTGQVAPGSAYPARQGLYIYAWGSVQSNDHVVLDVFDLSFSTPFLRMLPSRRFADRKLLKVDPYTSEALYPYHKGIVCQCALHDHGYHIELPSQPLATANPGRATRWPLLRIGAPKPIHAPDWGSIEHYFHTATQEAVERKAEWMREQIRKLKQAKMTDDVIIEVWFSRKWTGKGLVGLPNGWKAIKV